MRLSLFFNVAIYIASVSAVNPLVDLTYAKYQGQTLQNGVNQWLALRFAAPPTGKLRFAAPQPPLNQITVQDATQEGALCVSANNPEGLQFGSPRQRMAEDCLFLALYAPLNATETSMLPIMFFIQGGGFGSNSNGNFNGTGLVESSGMNMILVRINYRVGILGFIGGTAVNADKNGAVPNNGLNDMIAAARWVQKYATKFGGNPNHIVLSGDSTGGNAIDIILQANNGTGFPDLFVGAMAESTGMGSDGYAVNRDAELTKNFNSTGCLDATDPIDCMRNIPIGIFQNTTTKDGWGPTVDGGKWLIAPHYEMMEQGRFQKIPVIYGSTSNEGTPSFISNQSATTNADIANHITGSVGPSITTSQLNAMINAYPSSLNNVSFFGRNMTARNVTLRAGKGAQWQRDAAIQTELKLQCVSQFFSDMQASVGNPAVYHYRFDVLDTTPGGLADQGLFTPHTSELYAIWGSNNTDGGDPKCYKLPAAQGGCEEAISIVSSYWISFVRTLDPNKLRAPGSPAWQPWSIASPRRIVFENAKASMEVVGEETPVAGLNQRQRCLTVALPLAKVINAGLGANATLLPFANGTRVDPTLLAVKDGNESGSGSRNGTTGGGNGSGSGSGNESGSSSGSGTATGTSSSNSAKNTASMPFTGGAISSMGEVNSFVMTGVGALLVAMLILSVD